ncbi:flagellar hook-basal body complex protein FliE [Aestuariibacter halophilus]|uniref:Flagellar hook-basal body complex protein FliE n=1 Tax=Fluctibacter halophilus TaxID=226011 RepID=A0ABS8G628_9ALTE|nr:flagellar hook-basal body complex protein FliE [Aestuariibacter halophilus]MCC2615144.1 flagellar hook-basal body complex protein FliE [Aestuariibacter halophilus]
MDIKAQSLFSEMQAMASQARAEMTPIGNPMANNLDKAMDVNPSSSNFADMLGKAINTVNSMQLDSKEKQMAFEMGDKSLSLADVMVAKEKSGIAFEATVQVRNKVLEAYKQIMNMPV